MDKKKNSNRKYQNFFFFILLYGTLIIGYVLNEGKLAGSINDYYTHKVISKKFADDFFGTLLNFSKEPTRHSPLLIIIISFFEKLKINDNIIRLVNLHFLLLIILFFYKSLKIRFKSYNNSILCLISFVLFLSPSYRSLLIWPDSRLYGLLFFTISIYFFLNFINEKEKKQKFKFSILNTFQIKLLENDDIELDVNHFFKNSIYISKQNGLTSDLFVKALEIFTNINEKQLLQPNYSLVNKYIRFLKSDSLNIKKLDDMGKLYMLINGIKDLKGK